jgi:hypothetical protein
MDQINVLLYDPGMTALTPSVKYALTFARKLLNKYYSKTDLSNVYRVAMGRSSFSLHYFTINSCSIVLHPQLKLKYFQQHGWEKEWINTAEEIVRDEFKKYDVSDNKVPSPVHLQQI